MKTFIRIYVAIFLLAISSRVWAGSESSIGAFYIVDGVHKIVKRDDLDFNTVPWKLMGASETESNFEGEVFTVTLGCHFFDFEYLFYGTDAADKTISVRAQPGEFCDLCDLSFSRPTLINVRLWGGDAYLVDYAPVFFDDSGKAFITGFDLPSSWRMDEMLKPYPVSEQSEFCKSKESMSPRAVKNMTSSQYVQELGDKVCHSYVVSVDQVLNTIEKVGDNR